MNGLNYYLKAKCAAGSMNLRLIIERSEYGVELCLLGKYGQIDMQVDFDTLTPKEASDLADYLKLRADAANDPTERRP